MTLDTRRDVETQCQVTIFCRIQELIKYSNCKFLCKPIVPGAVNDGRVTAAYFYEIVSPVQWRHPLGTVYNFDKPFLSSPFGSSVVTIRKTYLLICSGGILAIDKKHSLKGVFNNNCLNQSFSYNDLFQLTPFITASRRTIWGYVEKCKHRV